MVVGVSRDDIMAVGLLRQVSRVDTLQAAIKVRVTLVLAYEFWCTTSTEDIRLPVHGSQLAKEASKRNK